MSQSQPAQPVLNRSRNRLVHQTSLGRINTCRRPGQLDGFRSPKLQKQSVSIEQYPGPLSLVRPSASLGNISSYKQRIQGRGGLASFRSTQSLLLEEPEIPQQADDLYPNTEQLSGNKYYNQGRES